MYCKYHPAYKGTEKEWVNALADGSLAASYDTHYNIIFTIATIPPVLASLDAIQSGYETYACIERGKTYNGIATLSNFHNVSFNASNNTSSGMTDEQMAAMSEKMQELNKFGNEKFHIYVQDSTGLFGFALAANAGLLPEQYEIILLEDGSGAYHYFNVDFIDGKTVSATEDQPYDAYQARLELTRSELQTILSKTDNKCSEITCRYDTGIVLSVLDQVTYWYQDLDQLEALLRSTDNGTTHSKLLSVYGVEGYDDEVELSASVRGDSISDMVSELTADEKSDYLRLMYGSAYEATYSALTRTTLSDGVTPVPANKLVYIGTRLKNFPTLASDAKYGIGGLGDGESVPADYASLPAKYKTSLLFGCEADYNSFLAALNDAQNYTAEFASLTADQQAAVKRACFNQFLNYVYVLKFAYVTYGQQYDIIMKGHPSEVIGNYQQWSSHYVEAGYTYDRLIDNVMLNFHSGDSMGKYMGMVPYGTAAENLAYLGLDLAIGGLQSSTYAGYDPAVDVKFVLNPIDGDITDDGNLASRYENGTLLNHDENGDLCDTEFFNVGYFYKAVAAIYAENQETDAAAVMIAKLQDWLRTVNGLAAGADLTGYDVDAQGFLTVPTV